MEELVQKIKDWAKNKGILDKATLTSQFLKTVEEVGEVSNAIGRNDLGELEDGIGDVTVTLIILSEIAGLNYKKCMERAYNEISQRKGKMVNGIFVKDEE